MSEIIKAIARKEGAIEALEELWFQITSICGTGGLRDLTTEERLKEAKEYNEMILQIVKKKAFLSPLPMKYAKLATEANTYPYADKQWHMWTYPGDVKEFDIRHNHISMYEESKTHYFKSEDECLRYLAVNGFLPISETFFYKP